MEAVAAIVAFALFLSVIYMVIRPFLAPEEIYDEAINSPELVSQKNRVIGAIREIDMDYQTGKLSDEDYKLLRSRYTSAAAEIIRRMDEEEAELTRAGANTSPQAESATQPVDTSVDEESGGDADEELERIIAERKATQKETR